MINTITQVQLIRRDMQRSIEIVASDPIVERQTNYYRTNIEKIETIDEFLADDRIYRYAMSAMGLEDMIYAKAFMRKVLEEGTNKKDSFANKLTDKRYTEFAEAFDFATFGTTATSLDRAKGDVVNKFMRQTLEKQQGEQNAGVRLALYFERKAPSIKSAYELLADKALAEVVYAALGLPDSFALSDIDKQAQYFKENVEINKLGDPNYLSKFLDRFSALYDLKNGPQTAASPTLAVFGSGPGVVPMSEGLLSSIQNFKLGGS